MIWRFLALPDNVVVWSKLRVHSFPLVRLNLAMSALDPLAVLNGIKPRSLLRADKCVRVRPCIPRVAGSPLKTSARATVTRGMQ